MDGLVVPSSPNWYNVDILVCAPDNTLIYGSKNGLVIIRTIPEDKPNDIKFIDHAHKERVTSVDVNIQWGLPNKWILSSGDDKYVKLWNIEKLENIYSHDVHKEQKCKIVGAKFLSENRVLSVSENGVMYLWRPSIKECIKLNYLFTMKVTITCFLPCPHDTYITAFGLKNGLIVVANIRKGGNVLFKLRGHNLDVVSLSWCPAPYNIFPKKPSNNKSITKNNEQIEVQPENNEDETSQQPSVSETFVTSDSSLNESKGEKSSNNKSITKNNEQIEVQPEKNEDETSQQPSVSETFETSDSSLNESKGEKHPDSLVPILTDEQKNSENTEASEKPAKETVDKIFDELLKCKIPNISKDSQITKNETDRSQEINEPQNDKGIEEEPSVSISEECPDEFNGSYTELKVEKEESEIIDGLNDQSPEQIKNKKLENITNKIVQSGENDRVEYLLASSGRDNAIYIWRAGSDGRIQTFFKIPEKNNQKHHVKKTKEVIWIVLKWITPKILLASNKRGELLKYSLPKPLKNQKQCSVVHNDHKPIIFSIAAHIPKSYEKRLPIEEIKVWTFGKNLYLLNTLLDSKNTHLTALETLSAVINCLAQSPLDPNRIAFGLSNGNIKIWNANDLNIRTFSTKHFSCNIHSKITCLAWHPKNEQVVAFCTEEGTIGLLNTYKFESVSWFKQTFANTVYKLQWYLGSNGKVSLYAVGEGALMCFNPDNTKAEPRKIAIPENTYAYTFAWKLDYSVLLLVHNSGKIMVLSSDLKVKAVFYQSKRLLCLTWHPDSESFSGEASERSHWIAAAMDNSLYVFDFAVLAEKNGTLDIQDITKTILNGHESIIKCLAWCPFNGNRLVSAGEDGLAHVWDVPTKQIISSFYEQNFQPLKSIMWSPIQADTLICSVANASLVVWKMSDYPAPLNEEVLEKCQQHMKKEKKSISSKVGISTEKSSKKLNKRCIQNVIIPPLSTPNCNSPSEKIKLLRELLEWKINGSDTKTNGVPNFKQVFGNQQDVLKLLNLTEVSHIERGKYEAATMVSFWKGDLHTSIREAIEQRRVSPLLISLAPTVSLSIWQKACETYASQLEENSDSDPLEMATYYMACQNIEKAITALCEKELFSEALCLAKCRLPEDNVFVEDILKKWATFSYTNGSFETAVQCHIVLGNLEEAAKVLFRRTDLDALNFALDLAKKCNKAEIISALEFRINAFEKGDIVHEEVEPLPDIKDLVLEKIKKEKQEATKETENINVDVEENRTSLSEECSDETCVSVLTCSEGSSNLQIEEASNINEEA